MIDVKIIRDLIEKFDWERIRSVHKLLNILWKEKDTHNIDYVFLPTIEELKEELFLILKFSVFKNIGILQSGCWLIMWHEETESTPAKLEAFFIAEEASIESVIFYDIEKLKMKLQVAINEEDYEEAASIRDKINRIQ